MNNYEGMFIVNPQLSDGDTEKLVDVIQEEIKKNNGEIINVDNIGRQHMAYPIKKFQDGYYLLIQFKGEGSLVEKIKAKYRINDNVLRTLILQKTQINLVSKASVSNEAGQVQNKVD